MFLIPQQPIIANYQRFSIALFQIKYARLINGGYQVINKIYSYITNEKRINTFRKIDGLAKKIGGNLYIKTLGQLKYHLRYQTVSEIEKNAFSKWRV